MRKMSVLILIVIMAVSCATSQANQSLRESTYSLTKVSPPGAFENIDRKSLRDAIISNLSYLEKIDRGTTFDYGGKIVRARDVIKTQKTLLHIIDTVESQEMFEHVMSSMFDWYKASGIDGKGSVIFTAYYIPEIEGSLTPSEKYRYPLYRPPDDLNNWKVYYTRKQIDEDYILQGKGLEIAWLADPVEAFFLHIQGSGVIKLSDGSAIGLHYAGNNQHPYTSIGKYMVEKGLIKPGEGNLQALKKYLRENPDQLYDILFENQRYIFFEFDNEPAKGSLKVALTPGHSIATDPQLFPKGGLSFIKTITPVLDASGNVIGWKDVKRFVLNQDEGGAIKGPGRVDIFWGQGDDAGLIAGSMKEQGELYFLIQR